MPKTEPYEGRTTIGSTAFSLVNESTTPAAVDAPGIYSTSIDFSALTVTEEYEVVIYSAVDAAGSQLADLTAVIRGTTQPRWRSPPLDIDRDFDVRVRKLAGTDRIIGWSITRVSD